MNQTNRLDEKVCLITGATGSIGLASARALLLQGASVMLTDLDAERLAAAARELGAHGSVAWRVADVTRAEQVQAAVQATLETFGAIDVLFSNAGDPATIAPLADYSIEAFDRTIAVHVRGAFLCCKFAIPAMRDGGSVIITSSVAGVRGDEGVYGYITAKHAQVGLMRAVSKEAARRGIRVNTLHPGPIDNAFQRKVENDLSAVIGRDATVFFDDAIPLHRHGRPDEVAQAVLFLASAQSSFCTGSLLMVDGGMSA